MPTFRHGKNTRVAIDQHNMSDYFNDTTTSGSVDTGETTTYGDEANTYVVGMVDAEMSFEGLFDGEPGDVHKFFHDSLGQEEPNVVTSGPEGDAAGNRAWLGHAYETSYEISSPVADTVSISVDMQVTEGTFHGYWFHDLAFSLESGSDDDAPAAQDAESTDNGAVLHAHVQSNDLDADAVVTLQDSPDGNTWTDVTSVTIPAGETGGFRAIVLDAVVGEHLRVNVDTTAAAAGEIKVATAGARRRRA